MPDPRAELLQEVHYKALDIVEQAGRIATGERDVDGGVLFTVKMLLDDALDRLRNDEEEA